MYQLRREFLLLEHPTGNWLVLAAQD